MTLRTPVVLNPSDPDAYLGKSLVLLDLGNYSEALECLNKTLDLRPRDAYAWIGKSLVYKKLGRNVDADAALVKAKELGYMG